MPVLDEAAALPGLLRELAAEQDPLAIHGLGPGSRGGAASGPGLLERTVFVDNGSRDGSRELLLAHGARVVDEPRRGYGYACLSGAGAALSRGAGAVAFMEADGSDDPRDLPFLVGPLLRAEADLVIGVRGHGASEWAGRGARAMPAHQRLGNRLAAACLRLLFGLDVPDNGPFRAIDASLLRRLEMEARPYAWTTEMLVKAHLAGARVAFVGVRHRPRAGRSKIAGTARGTLGAFGGIFVTMARLWLGTSRRRRH